MIIQYTHTHTQARNESPFTSTYTGSNRLFAFKRALFVLNSTSFMWMQKSSLAWYRPNPKV